MSPYRSEQRSAGRPLSLCPDEVAVGCRGQEALEGEIDSGCRREVPTTEAADFRFIGAFQTHEGPPFVG